MIIGKINIPQAILLAPMEDVTDISFRLICKRLGADIVYTEFVNSEGLVRKSKQAKRKMTFIEQERPFGIQLYGGGEESMTGAARMAEELQPDLIDINCGCWVKNVVGHGAGAGLLRDLGKMKSIISSVTGAVELPVTVKTRLGWDASTIQIVDVAKLVEDAGAKGLTIHCRTREQGHKGDPDYSWIPRVKESVNIPIMVNGGIDTPAAAKQVFGSTGCDGIMIARGAIQNPWIFREIKHYLSTGSLLAEPSVEERADLLIEHLRLSIEQKGPVRGITEFRKHYSGYLRNLPWISSLRIKLMTHTAIEPIIEDLRHFLENLPDSAQHETGEALAA
ncbi:MAG: tRNA dihydrouridine synthase DusB [Ignavibacteria bacterium]|nr:MAG: tRNA dihydrouridine synthase DusB [Ignavibacteria bacterium]